LDGIGTRGTLSAHRGAARQHNATRFARMAFMSRSIKQLIIEISM